MTQAKEATLRALAPSGAFAAVARAHLEKLLLRFCWSPLLGLAQREGDANDKPLWLAVKEF